MQPAKAETLKVPGARLYFEVRGAGPVLMIIPAGPMDAGVFAGLAGILADAYTDAYRLPARHREAAGRVVVGGGVASRGQVAHRAVTRRLRGMAALDPELERLLGARDELRRSALRSLLERFGDGGEAVDVIWQLTSFETFHALSGDDRDTAEVARMLSTAAIAVLGDG